MKIVHTSTNGLSSNTKNNILNLYVEIFSAPPLLEKIDRQKIRQEFFGLNSSISVIFECNKEKAVLGFILSCDIASFCDIERIPNIKKNSAYLSSFALSSKLREKGVGKQFLSEHLDLLSDRYKYVYTRSRTDIPNIIHILLLNNFKISFTYKGITNGVPSEKNIYRKKI